MIVSIILGAVALALLVELLLLVEAPDDFLQAGFHVACDVAGLAQVLDDRGREQSYGWCIRQRRLCEYQHGGCKQQSERRLASCAIDTGDGKAGVLHVTVLVASFAWSGREGTPRHAMGYANRGPLNTS
jgi:hypothetical protein